MSAANLVIPVHIVPSSGPRPANQEPWKKSPRPRLVLCRGTEKITAEPVQSQSQGAAWPTTQQCFSPCQRHHRAQLCTEVGGVLLEEAKRKQTTEEVKGRKKKKSTRPWLKMSNFSFSTKKPAGRRGVKCQKRSMQRKHGAAADSDTNFAVTLL